MPILAGDIKLVASQVMDDIENGGGAPTPTAIQDGVSNSIFNDISELDRAGGRVNLRKVFASVQTQSTDTYMGGNIIVADPPDDPNVSVTIFSTGDVFDRREEATGRIESYLAAGPEWAGFLWENHIVGQRVIQILARPTALPPATGRTLVLRYHEGLSDESEQYVRITRVATEERTLTYSTGQGYVDYQAVVITCDLSDALRFDFPGSVANRAFSRELTKTIIRDTIVADASVYAGATPITTAVTVGELKAKAQSAYSQLVPNSQTEISVLDVKPSADFSIPLALTPVEVSVGGAPFSQRIRIGQENRSYNYINILTPAPAPGSVKISFRALGNTYSITDDGEGNLSGAGSGTINYTTGSIAVTLQALPDDRSAVVFYWGQKVSYTSLAGTAGFRRPEYSYTLAHPGVTPGSVVITWLSGGETKTASSTAAGKLTGDAAGEVNHITGMVFIRPNAMLDAGGEFSINYTWSTMREEFIPGLTADPTGSILIALDEEPVPGSVEVQWLTMRETKISAGTSSSEGSSSKINKSVATLTNNTVGSSGSTGSTSSDTSTATTAVVTPNPVWEVDIGVVAGVEGQQYYVPYSPYTVPPGGAVGRTTIDDTTYTTVTTTVNAANNSTYSSSTSAEKAKTIASSASSDSSSGGSNNSASTRAVTVAHSVTDDGAGGLFGGVFGTVSYVAKSLSLKAVADYSESSYQSNYENARAWEKLNNTAEAANSQTTDAGSSTNSNNSASTNATNNSTSASANSITTNSGGGGSATAKGGTFGTSAYKEFLGSSTVFVRYKTGIIAPQSATETLTPPAVIIDLCPMTKDYIVPGSLQFTWMGTVYRDSDGVIYRDMTSESPGTASGRIDYVTGLAAMYDYVVNGSPTAFAINSLWTKKQAPSVANVFFQTQTAPIKPAGLIFSCLDIGGNQLLGTAGIDGMLTGTHMRGTIDYQTGLVEVLFGDYIADATLTDAEKNEWWYTSGDVRTDGKIWRPWSVDPTTLRYNAVSYTYLPLDANILGLDPVRLPQDGRVPIFRPGGFAVLGHTGTLGPFTLINGDVKNCGRVRLSRIRVIGSDGNVINTGYTANLEAGTVTFSDVSSYLQPVTIEHRIEDMAMVSDVQINGEITFTRQITHDYPIGSVLSSALVAGDLRSRIPVMFDQASWDGTYADAVTGGAATGTYNDVLSPIAVTNIGASTERWCIQFTNTTTFNVIGEHVGVIATGNTSSDIAPINPATGQPYFSLAAIGWGAGWSAGNVLRFNTVGALFPVWVVRTVQQGPETVTNDSFTILIRGDVDRP